MNTHVRGRETHARRTFIEVTPELRHILEGLIEAAIDALDQIDGDLDAEDGADAEPSFGWTEREGRFGVRHQVPDELEPDNDAEDGADAEPDEDLEDGGDDEPTLGWTERVQAGVSLDGECEPSLGWTAAEAAEGVPFRRSETLPFYREGGDEPSLGWTEDEAVFGEYTGSGQDLEEASEDEGAQCDDEGDDSGDREPWLGWNEAGGHGGSWMSSAGFEA